MGYEINSEEQSFDGYLHFGFNTKKKKGCTQIVATLSLPTR